MRGEPVKTETFKKHFEWKLRMMQQRKIDFPETWDSVQKERTNDVKMTVLTEVVGRLAKAVNAHDDGEITDQLIKLAATAAFWATDDESEVVDERK